jgi:hypothetical protein
MIHPSTLATETKRTTDLRETLNARASGSLVNIGVIERLASLAVGAVVVLLIARRLLLYLGLAVVSGYLGRVGRQRVTIQVLFCRPLSEPCLPVCWHTALR